MPRLVDFNGPKDIATWQEQIEFWKTHLDVFLEDVLGLRLKDVQRVMARAIGNCTTGYIVASRGFG